MKDFDVILTNFVISVAIDGKDIYEMYDLYLKKHQPEFSLIEYATVEFYSYMLCRHVEIIVGLLRNYDDKKALFDLMFEVWRIAKDSEWKRHEWFKERDIILYPIPAKLFEEVRKEVKILDSDQKLFDEMIKHLKSKFDYDDQILEDHVREFWKKKDGWIKPDNADTSRTSKP